MSNSTIYSSIKSNQHEIRLVVLEGGQPSDLIQCSLQVRGLDEVEDKFEALSYVWGDRSDPENTPFNAQLFPATKNPSAALKSPRSEDDLILWIDAICINQGCVKERSEQGTFMDAIYKAANTVVC